MVMIRHLDRRIIRQVLTNPKRCKSVQEKNELLEQYLDEMMMRQEEEPAQAAPSWVGGFLFFLRPAPLTRGRQMGPLKQFWKKKTTRTDE